jgi:acetyl esterase/lipase
MLRLEIYPELPHVFQNFAGLLPEAALALQETATFIKRAQPDNADPS